MVGRSLLLLTTNYRSKSAAFIGQISTMQQNSLQFFPWDDMCGAQCTGRNAGSLRHPWGTLHPNRMTFACALADHDPGRKILDLVIFAYPTLPPIPQDAITSSPPGWRHTIFSRYSQLLNLHVSHEEGNPQAWPRHTKPAGRLWNGNLDWLTCVFYVGMMLIYPPVI